MFGCSRSSPQGLEWSGVASCKSGAELGVMSLENNGHTGLTREGKVLFCDLGEVVFCSLCLSDLIWEMVVVICPGVS